MVREKTKQPNPGPQPVIGERNGPRTFDLDRIDPDDAVRIDGESYRLARGTDLSIMQKAAVKRATTRMAYIEGKEQPNAKDNIEWLKLAREIARIALPDLPDAVVAKLGVEQLGAIMVVFFGRTAETSKLLRLIPEMLSTFPSPSPSSSTSTKATL